MAYELYKTFELSFEVKRIIKRMDNSFTVMEIKTNSFCSTYTGTRFKTMTLRGFFPIVFVGDVFAAKVEIKENPKFGYYVDIVSDLVYVIPHTKKALITFLKKRVSNLKKEEAEELVSIGGRQTITKLVNTPEFFVGKTSLTKIRIKNIRKKVEGDIFLEDLMLLMQAMKIDANIAFLIYQKFEINSVFKIKNNPYSICSIKDLKFLDADRMALFFGMEFNDVKRIKSAILEFLFYQEKTNGDVCVLKSSIFNNLSMFLSIHGEYSPAILKEKEYVETGKTKLVRVKKVKEEAIADEHEESEIKIIKDFYGNEKEILSIKQDLIKESYDRLVEKGKIIERINSNGEEVVYLRHLYEAETSVIKSIDILTNTSNLLCSEDKIKALLANNKNAKNQNLAIQRVFKHRCSILTGGPGTGKTYTVNQIVECYKMLKPDANIMLLAPTGRASSKLSEVTSLPSSTIHKALKIQPTESLSYYNTKGEPVVLDADLVICDESSMNDIIIFSMLLEAISLETTLLIVGDDNQLSPVGPGLVLRDLIESGVVPTTCLNEIFRQAQESQIVQNAHKLQKGLTSKSESGLTFDTSKGDFYFIQRNTIQDIAKTMIEMTIRLVEVKKISIWDILLLSPIRNDIIGVYNLNRELQIQLNPESKYKNEFKIDAMTTLREGDKVINTENDESLGVNNGDIGKIERIEFINNNEVLVDVEFPYGTVTFNNDCVKNLELAYCITVHKSQGTEAKVVLMPISPSHMFNLNKRLVYTAWTRAKEMVICVGDLNTLDKIILKEEYPRRSYLKERLQK